MNHASTRIVVIGNHRYAVPAEASPELLLARAAEGDPAFRGGTATLAEDGTLTLHPRTEPNETASNTSS